MAIGVCGYGYSGSGAVIDLLKEYEGLSVLDSNEFCISYDPDGIEDLFYHLVTSNRFMDSDIAVCRFINYINYSFRPRARWGKGVSASVKKITNELISDVCDVCWNGTWGRDVKYPSFLGSILKWHVAFPVSKCFKRLFKKYLYPYRTIFLAKKNFDFRARLKQYMSDVLNAIGYSDNDCLVVNQPFSVSNPEKSFPFFNNPKAIIVDRDPRDIYFLCKYELKVNCTWMPLDSVEQFVKYFKNVREHRRFSENVLYVRFEDLVYRYNETVKKIESFLGISSINHVNPKSVFKPEISKYNTQLFKKYASCKKEIAIIEKELKDFLFDYSNFDELDSYKKAF